MVVFTITVEENEQELILNLKYEITENKMKEQKGESSSKYLGGRNKNNH